MTTIKEALPTTHFGTIPKGRQYQFYRVETWKGGHFIADFALKSQAEEFAISDARATGARHDHKVSQMRLSGQNN